MNQSESIKGLFSAVLAVQTAIEPVVKDAENPFFHSKYASRDNILAAVKSACQAHGLCVTQWPADNGMVTHLAHPDSGEYKEIYTDFVWDKKGPQAHGAYLTYMSRYALCTIFLIELPDDDANSATTQDKPAAAKKATDPPTSGKKSTGQTKDKKLVYAGLLKALDATERAADPATALEGWVGEHGEDARELGGNWTEKLLTRYSVLKGALVSMAEGGEEPPPPSE